MAPVGKYLHDLADEIERLNAEVTHYAQAYHREMVANKKLQAVADAAQIMRKQAAKLADYADLTSRLQEQCDKYMSNALDAWDRVKVLEDDAESRQLYVDSLCQKIERLRAALKQIEARGLDIINEHVGGSDASYVAQELTSMALAALEETDDA